MKKSVPGLLALLALVGLTYDSGHSRTETNIVHADEASKWTKVEAPLTISHNDKLKWVSAQGYWQLTSPTRDKQPMSPTTATIVCTQYNKTCGEIRASVSHGVLQADSFNYYIASWTLDSIVADDFDEGTCGLAHRLSLNFKNNSVTVADYPKDRISHKNCQPFKANSYTLHGGQVVLQPPAPWAKP